MNEGSMRVMLYGGMAVVLAGLGIAVATNNVQADVQTLLSSVDVQLRLAYAMPERDLQGRELPAREELIAAAEEHLANVERQQPGLACSAEFRGFAKMLRGDWAAAAAAYGEAQRSADCQAEQRDVLAFNEARMLAKAGDGDGALRVFARHAAALDARFGHQRVLEEAGILRDLRRPEEADQRLCRVLDDASAPPMATLQAGLELGRLGQLERADAVLQQVSKALPIADGHRARLKLAAGAADTALELLERAEAAVPAEVRRLVREEPDAWQAVADDARFLRLTAPRPATPGR